VLCGGSLPARKGFKAGALGVKATLNLIFDIVSGAQARADRLIGRRRTAAAMAMTP